MTGESLPCHPWLKVCVDRNTHHIVNPNPFTPFRRFRSSLMRGGRRSRHARLQRSHHRHLQHVRCPRVCHVMIRAAARVMRSVMMPVSDAWRVSRYCGVPLLTAALLRPSARLDTYKQARTHIPSQAVKHDTEWRRRCCAVRSAAAKVKSMQSTPPPPRHHPHRHCNQHHHPACNYPHGYSRAALPPPSCSPSAAAQCPKASSPARCVITRPSLHHWHVIARCCSDGRLQASVQAGGAPG